MAEINYPMVYKIAEKIKELPISAIALTFTGEDQFPQVGDPGALNYFFATVMHNYGFWIGDGKGYVEPLYGEFNGRRLRGSDLIWALSMKVYREKGPEFFNPVNLAVLPRKDFYSWLPESIGFQDLQRRYSTTLLYGSYFLLSQNPELPQNIIDEANASSQGLQGLLRETAKISGYDSDGLLKKNLLLAMILANRPEHFLKVEPEDFKDPIVDYHLMRVALRLGLINLDWIEWGRLEKRMWADEFFENKIRQPIFNALKMVIELSGKLMSEVDFLLWSARRYCPEMTPPDCPKCVFSDVCQKNISLFQPVFRTTNY